MTRFVPLLAAAALAAAGCDRLPWASKDDASAAGQVTTAQSGAVPTRAPVLPAEVVAVVNGVAISKADVQLRLQELKALVEGAGETWTPLTAEQSAAVLDELIGAELMSQDAVARGLDRTLDLQRRWDYLRRGFFAQAWLQQTQESLEVGAGEVEAYYEQNKEGFRDRESVQLRQLTVTSEDQAKQALAQLYGGSVSVEQLAKQISVSPSAPQGGLLPQWAMRATDKEFMALVDPALDVIALDPALENAAFAIADLNGLSSYVKGADNRYHIFQLVARRPAQQRALTEVWDQIKNFLLLQTLQERVDALEAKAAIERHPERLEGIAP